jgi:hypothetical protein
VISWTLESRDADVFQNPRAVEIIFRLTLITAIAKIGFGGSRKGSKGNAVRVHLLHATPRLPPQL